MNGSRPLTALFGGTFDPPHVGHREAVNGLFAISGVRAVRVLVSPQPPHKPTRAPVEDRIAMSRLAFAQHTMGVAALRGPVEIDLCEIERARLRPSVPTYTYDTLQELRPSLGELAFVIGTDQLLALPTWHRFPEVLGLCHWIVLDRKSGNPATAAETPWRRMLSEWQGSGLIQNGPGGQFQVRSGTGSTLSIHPTDAPALSSTQIRELLARTGQPPAGSILPEVHAYLMKQRLYGTGPS